MAFLQRQINRGSVSTGYDIDNSLKLEADNSEYLQKANDSGTNRKTFTVSMWFKRTELANDYMQLWQGGQNGEATRLGFYGGTPKEAIWVDVGGGSGNTGADYRSYSVQLARDTSAWMHIVLAVDTTQGTASNRLKVWINGDQITTWTNQAIPAQDFQCSLEANINMHWGAYNSTYYKMCGYIAECHYLDGVAKVPTDFGEYDEDSGIWIPKKYDGTYGGNGCYLKFDDSSDLGADSSGNGNDFTLNNISAADQATDTPTNNFCTLNPLHNYYNETSKFVITEGGTKVTGAASGTSWRGVPSTFAPSNGKWYFELSGSGSYILIGAGSADTGQSQWFELTSIASNSTKAKMMYSYNGGIYGYNSSTDAWQYGFGFGHGTAYNVGVAVDLDNGHMYFSKDGAAYTDSGDPTSGSTGTGAIDLPWYDTESTVFIVTVANSGSTSLLNFGGYTSGSISSAASDANGYGTFEYAPPSGYYALCGKNLAEFG